MEFKFDVTPRNDFVDIDLHDYTLFPRNEVEAMNYTSKFISADSFLSLVITFKLMIDLCVQTILQLK